MREKMEACNRRQLPGIGHWDKYGLSHGLGNSTKDTDEQRQDKERDHHVDIIENVQIH